MIDVGEGVRDAFSNLLVHRQRSALALLGIVIGTASVVALLSIGHMAGREAVRLFSRIGLDTVVVSTTLSSPDDPNFDPADIAALPGRVKGVARATVLVTTHLLTQVHGAPQSFNLAAGAADLADMAGLQIERGRFIREVDGDNLVAVVGADVAANILGSGTVAHVGQRILVGRYSYTVIGVLRRDRSNALNPTDFNNAVVIPLAGSHRAVGALTPNAALVRVQAGTDPVAVAAHLAAHLQQINPKVHFQVQSARQLIETIKAQRAIETRLLTAIGAISLLVGGIGVMNVMLMNLMERRREIGLRAAIGARPRDIQLMFLAEAGALSFAGGVLGALVGVLMALVAAKSSAWAFSVPLYAVPLGAGVATSVGLVFGLYPAVRAARLDPIEMLRAE